MPDRQGLFKHAQHTRTQQERVTYGGKRDKNRKNICSPPSDETPPHVCGRTGGLNEDSHD